MAGLHTPLPGLGADPLEQKQLFQNAVMNIVQQGSPNDLMDAIIVDYGTGIGFRVRRSKAKYLMAVYREGNKQKAHLKAGIFFLATRLNFVSPDLEYLVEAYVAEMQAAMQAGERALRLHGRSHQALGSKTWQERNTLTIAQRRTLQYERAMQGPCLIILSKTGERKNDASFDCR
jgi:hypothetical protein